MLTKTELKILKQLFEDLIREYSIRELSLVLSLPYPQTHRAVSSLLKKNLVKKKQKGKSEMISLSLEETRDSYVEVEKERKEEVKNRYKLIKILLEDLGRLEYNQFICLLFGSYAEKKARANSDIDLLFVLPEEYDYAKFEKAVKYTITLAKVDINITTEKGLMEMWQTPLKLNVGNEVLKKHVVLFGGEQFLRLRRKYYFGG